MIAFKCQMCERTFERPDEAAGTLVFCPCGAANRVPWESTIALPPSAPVPVLQAAEVPMLQPAGPARWGAPAARDPNYCLNHQHIQRHAACADCRESFSPDCLVSFAKEMLCGPCKNFRIRALQRPPRLSVMAILATIIGLVGGLVGPFLQLMSIGLSQTNPGSNFVPGATCFGLAPQVVALILGLLALRQVETNPEIGGRGLAVTGVVAALVFGATSVELMLLFMMLLG